MKVTVEELEHIVERLCFEKRITETEKQTLDEYIKSDFDHVEELIKAMYYGFIFKIVPGIENITSPLYIAYRRYIHRNNRQKSEVNSYEKIIGAIFASTLVYPASLVNYPKGFTKVVLSFYYVHITEHIPGSLSLIKKAVLRQLEKYMQKPDY